MIAGENVLFQLSLISCVTKSVCILHTGKAPTFICTSFWPFTKPNLSRTFLKSCLVTIRHRKVEMKSFYDIKLDKIQSIIIISLTDNFA